MPPRHHTLPPAQTSSAREAQKSFYCELCAKGYTRMNDYEAHLSSYDHSHKQRLKDMKAMVRDSSAGARARKADDKAGGLLSIKLPSSGAGAANTTAGAGFKKGGFKKSGFKSTMAPIQGATVPVPQPTQQPTAAAAAAAAPAKLPMATDESDTEDEGYEVYDPRYPTD
ncbi:Putative C2H2 type zinc finger domain-containing protein [[Torrubiella] hemipterigena]|uniref:Putative C2H2 type zinc finger domain-containing protein n=1 Tax=[Torrubiella] hemipterigena TaxID=1531966 RepID=A0A0A1TGK4_9HYPO|nr:Putative C2H2 type zinc finger domain-containing protein [[Torrubiella] hemipterigena]